MLSIDTTFVSQIYSRKEEKEEILIDASADVKIVREKLQRALPDATTTAMVDAVSRYWCSFQNSIW